MAEPAPAPHDPSPGAAAAPRWSIWAALAAIIVLAAVLRVWGLRGECFYSDECASTRHLGAPSLVQFLTLVRSADPPMTPVFFVLEYGWARLVGQDPARLRLLPLFFGLVAVPLVYLLGRLVHGRAGGLAAALFFSCSLPQIYYAQEMRPYALVLVLTLLALIALWQALHRQRAGVWWLLHWTCCTLVVWCHLFTVFFLAGVGVFLLLLAVMRRRWSLPLWWGLSQAPNALLLLLWVRSINYGELAVAASWRLEIVHSYLQPLSDWLLFAGAGVPLFRDMPLAGGMHMAGLLWRFFAVVFLLYLALSAWRMMPSRTRGGVADRTAFVFVTTLLCVPSLLLFAVSATVYACHGSRYVLYGSIPFALMVGGAVALLPRRWMRAVLVAAITAVQVANLGVHPKPWRPDARAAARHLQTMAGPDAVLTACVAADIPSLVMADEKGLPMRRIIGCERIEDLASVFENGEPARAPENWLIVWTHQRQPESLKPFEASLRAAGWNMDRVQFGTVNPVFVYRASHP